MDDLDRVDPEHVFRILNIFSAYFEKEENNKFGFDKVIVVADYQNLKRIFEHRYGKGSDFSGYLDKFYTIAPYHFDNNKAVLHLVDDVVTHIKNGDENLRDALGDSGYIRLFVRHFFVAFIDEELMNLRELLKATRFQLNSLNKGSFYEDVFADNFQKIIDIAIEVLIKIVSGREQFLSHIEKIKKSSTRTVGRMPYSTYSASMLKSLGVQVPDTDNETIIWNEYSVTKDAREKKNKDAELFYDLLTEYIKQKKYVKSSPHEYVR